MGKQVEYYFTSLSPFTYLGHTEFCKLTGELDTEVQFKPVILGKVFASSGVTPLPQRPKSRIAYRFVELERWANKRALPIVLQPAHFPTDPSLADKCVIVLQQGDVDASAFISQVLSACWSQEQDIAQVEIVNEILSNLGLDAESVIAQSQDPKIQAIYEQNTTDAIESGVLGVPSYLVNGEQFWGQDRLELLSDILRK